MSNPSVMEINEVHLLRNIKRKPRSEHVMTDEEYIEEFTKTEENDD